MEDLRQQTLRLHKFAESLSVNGFDWEGITTTDINIIMNQGTNDEKEGLKKKYESLNNHRVRYQENEKDTMSSYIKKDISDIKAYISETIVNIANRSHS